MRDAVERFVDVEVAGERIALHPMPAAAFVRARARKLRSAARTSRIVSRLLVVISHRLVERAQQKRLPPPPVSGVRLRASEEVPWPDETSS